MSQQQLLIRTLRTLNAAEVPYFLTGSVVSSIQGEPRLTHDIDVVVVGSAQLYRILLAEFGDADFYLDEEMIRQATESSTMFNLLEIRTGDKVDFWMLRDEAFDECRLSRRVAIDYHGTSAWISSPEDTIIAKLRWAKASGGSQRQIGDARSVFEANQSTLDRRYIDQWVARLGLKDQWHACTGESGNRLS